MTNQMSEMQHEVDDKLKAEQALKAAEQARKEVGASSSPAAQAGYAFLHAHKNSMSMLSMSMLLQAFYLNKNTRNINVK